MQDLLRRFKAEFFKALAHPARIKILELLRSGEMSVNELQTHLEIEPSTVSQQLAVLRGRNIVEARKVGTSVYYRVRDPQIFELLEVARRIFNTHLIDTQSMLEQLEEEEAVDSLIRPAQRATPTDSR
jgi:ArsR family transcriptional regulator